MELLYDTQPRLHAKRSSLAVSSPSTFHSFNLDRHYQMSQAPWTGSPGSAGFTRAEYDYGYGSSSPLPGPTLSSGPQAPEQPLSMYNGWSPEDLKLMNKLTPSPNASSRSVQPSQEQYPGAQPSIPGIHTAGLDYRKQAVPTAQVSVGFAQSQHVPDDSRHSYSAEPAGDAFDSKVLRPPTNQYSTPRFQKMDPSANKSLVGAETRPTQTAVNNKGFYLDSLREFADRPHSSYYYRKEHSEMKEHTPVIVAVHEFPTRNSNGDVISIRLGTRCLHMRNNDSKKNWESFCQPPHMFDTRKRTSPTERAACLKAEQSVENLLPPPQALKSVLSKAWQIASKEWSTNRERWLPGTMTTVDYNVLSRMSQLVEGRVNRHMVDVTTGDQSQVSLNISSIPTLRWTRDDGTFASCSESPALLHISDLFPSATGQFTAETAKQFDSIALDPDVPIPNFVVGSVDLSAYDSE